MYRGFWFENKDYKIIYMGMFESFKEASSKEVYLIADNDSNILIDNRDKYKFNTINSIIVGNVEIKNN